MRQSSDKAQWDTIIRPRRSWFDIDFKGVAKYRDLIYLLVKRHFTLVYRQTVLGPMWIIIQPLLTTLVFTVIFGNIAGLPTDGMPKFLFYMAGNILWHFFATCLTATSNTFLNNKKLFGKVYFPRLCMPISVVLSQMVNFMVQFVLFAIFVIYYAYLPTSSVSPDWKLILLTPLLLIQLGLLGMGCGIIVSALTARYRDLAMLVSFGVNLWMYASPVTYSASMIADRFPALAPYYMLNPVTPVINLFRAAYLGMQDYSFTYNLVSLGITAVIVFFGVILFSRTEKTFMDTI